MAFTTMALIGLAAYSGAKATKDLVAKKKAAKLAAAPAPVPTPTAATPPTVPTIGAPTPPDATRAASDAQAAGIAAASKQRKRAASGGTTSTLLGQGSGAGKATATLQPKTLLGGY